MNPRRHLPVLALLVLSLFACRSSEEGAGGGVGGTGGADVPDDEFDPCDPVLVQGLVAEEEPVRLYGPDRRRPERIGVAFRSAEADPVASARSFLRRMGPRYGLPEGDGGLEVRTVKRGLAGSYVRFEQRHLGLPVFHREVVVHVAPRERGSEVKQARLDHARLPAGLDARPGIAGEAAATVVREALGADELATPALGFLEYGGSFRLVYRTLAGRTDPPGSWEAFVDARDGTLLDARDLLRHVDGTGLVFDPNPVASTGDATLADRGGVAYEELDAARIRVALPRLDGSGYLRGAWVDARTGSGAERAHSPDLVFDFDRSQDGFEETMAYFHLDRTQARLQELGFTDILNRPVVVNVNGTRADNSWYDPRTKEITTGTGGVDDAEDADVLVHEYGHAVQGDQLTMLSMGGDSGALGEGFADYLAASIADTFSPQVIDPACLAAWNATSYREGNPPCLRRVDGTKHYPESLVGEVHYDGEIWSAVLWELRESLDADVMDRLIVESHFSYGFGEKFAGAAAALLEADRALYGGRHLDVLVPALTHRGLLRTPMPPALFPDVIETRDLNLRSPRSGDLYPDRLDHTEVIRVPGAAGLRLYFVEVATEAGKHCVTGGCDNIYLTDDRGFLFQILNGYEQFVESVVIPGEAVHVRLVTNRTHRDFGYWIARVDVMGYRTCGNGLRDGAEACDGADLAGQSCTSLGFAEGTLACGGDCRLDVSGCIPAPGCGDGAIGPGEECDGAELGGASCTSLDLGAGTLVCSAACRFDTSACSTCGNGRREGIESCDGDDLAGLTCEALGLGPGVLSCSEACTVDTSGCLPAGC